jgi:hypothetical protein
VTIVDDVGHRGRDDGFSPDPDSLPLGVTVLGRTPPMVGSR